MLQQSEGRVDVEIRQAVEKDVPEILSIVNYYAAQDLMLPRSAEQIRRALPGFVVAEDEGRVVGCGSLVELTPRLVEVRSVAVAPDYKAHGLGRRIVQDLVERARKSGYEQACALTLVEGFFNTLGFETVDRWALAPKVWHECIYCPKFDRCDEIAVLMNLTETAGAQAGERRQSELRGALWRHLVLGRAANR